MQDPGDIMLWAGETLTGILCEKLKVKQSEDNEQQNTSPGNPKSVFVLEFVFCNLQRISSKSPYILNISRMDFQQTRR